jgi:hypothetical protein
MPPTQKWELGTRIFAPTFVDYIDILHTPNILLKENIFACYINKKFQNK